VFEPNPNGPVAFCPVATFGTLYTIPFISDRYKLHTKYPE